MAYIIHASDGKRFANESVKFSKALTPRSCMFFIHRPSAQAYQPSCLDTAPFLSHHHPLENQEQTLPPPKKNLKNPPWRIGSHLYTLRNSLPPTPSRLTRVPVRRSTGWVHESCAYLHWVKKVNVYEMYQRSIRILGTNNFTMCTCMY